MTRRRLGFWRRLVVILVKPLMLVLTRPRWQGVGQLPADGGVIVVVNHLSHADPLVVAHFLHEARRWPQFLGKQSLFDVPVLGGILRRLRQIPVRRGTAEAARSLAAAQTALREGGTVVIYPEGTTTRDPEQWPMRAHTGVARLWLATGVPVVPVAIWGPQRIFDPNRGKLRLRPRTPVSVFAGPPVDLAAHQGATATSATMHEIADTVMLRVRDLLAELRGQPAPPVRTSEGATEVEQDRPR